MVVIPFRPRKPKDAPVVPLPKKALSIIDVSRAYILASICMYAIPIIIMLDFFQNGVAPHDGQTEDRDGD